MALKIHLYKKYAVVAKYEGDAREIIIPKEHKGLPVTQILDEAFINNQSVESIYIPTTLQAIGDRCFSGCTQLRFVRCSWDATCPKPEHGDPVVYGGSDFPPSLSFIGENAFCNTAVYHVQFHSPQLKICDGAFEACAALYRVSVFQCEYLILGKRVFKNSTLCRIDADTLIPVRVLEETFAECRKLRAVLMDIHTMGPRSFYNCVQWQYFRAKIPVREVKKDALFGCDILETDLIPGFVSQAPQPAEEAANPAEGKMPLLVFQVGCQNPDKEALVYQLTGKFECKDTSAPLFHTQIPDSLHSETLQLASSQDLPQLMPLLQYLDTHNLTVTLRAYQRDGVYFAEKILPDATDDEQDFCAGFYHHILDRLKKPTLAEKNTDAQSTVCHISGAKEMDAYVEICADHIPEWVLAAYNRNKDVVQRSSLVSDERKHAKKAQELLINIDWSPPKTELPTIAEAKHILDQSFYGLEEVKEHILEVVAQIRRTGKLPKWGILLVGPAGTAKTSIAKAIFQLLKLPLIQLDMSTIGGSEDVDAISGSPRIYTNARPGQILNRMDATGSCFGGVLVNEVDKATPQTSKVLLTILDKTGLYENYLEEVIPTDGLFCIGTCNDLGQLTKPLQDRFLVIHLPPYTKEEKRKIWEDYTLPTVMASSQLTCEQMEVAEEATELLLSEYFLEAGARDVERCAERLVRNYLKQVETQPSIPKRIYTPSDIRDIFGPGQMVQYQFAIHPGAVNCAFSLDGAAHFFPVEAIVCPGNGEFEVLGPISDIQKEYCKTAYWCVGNTTDVDLSKLKILVFIPQQLPESAKNYVGLATYVAICGRLLKVNLAIQRICFVGGCSLEGSLYFCENQVTPLLRAMKNRGIETLYAPMGVSKLVDSRKNKDSALTILEAADAKTLFSLAVARDSLGV